MKYLIIILIVLIPCLSFSADMTNRQLWDVTHVTGSCIGTAYLNHTADMSWKKAALYVLALGLAKESIDHIFYLTKTKSSMFDHYRGFEVTDIILNGIGVSISFPIRRR